MLTVLMAVAVHGPPGLHCLSKESLRAASMCDAPLSLDEALQVLLRGSVIHMPALSTRTELHLRLQVLSLFWMWIFGFGFCCPDLSLECSLELQCSPVNNFVSTTDSDFG